MANWHGYFVVERGTISAGNWSALRALYETMGTSGSAFPMWNNHRRARGDGDAVIYESLFDASEVSIDEFKQLLADEFGVAVGDIDNSQAVVSYGGVYDTTVWEFLYNSVVRFTVRRFGRGGPWNEGRAETIAFLASEQAAWEPV